MRKALLSLWLVIGFFHSAYAYNLSFLNYSPTYYFTDQDWALAEKAVMDSLNRGRNNVAVSWNNPKTGAKGYAMPLNTTTQNGLTCRQVRIYSEAHEMTGASTYQFCKINGAWRVK